MEFLTCWCSFKVCNQKCVYFLHDLPPCTDFCECEECNNTKRDDKNDFDALVEEQEKCLLWYNYSDNSECKYISLIQFYFFLYFFFFFFFFIFVLFLIMLRLSHIWVSCDICKLLKSYDYEEGFSETITSFLLASSKSKKKINVLVISYCVLMALKHFTFGFIFTSIRSKF